MKNIEKNQKLKSLKVNKHLIFFDASCPLCQKAVLHILSVDKDCIYLFSPLDGKTAEKFFSKEKYLKLNTLVLVENFDTHPKIYIRSRAVFRIFFHIGGIYRAMGLFAFIPPLFDPIYRLIAHHRHKMEGRKNFSIPEGRSLP